MIIDNSEDGVQIRRQWDFAKLREIEFPWVPQTAAQQDAALGRAHSQIGHRYNIFHANCEHFVHWVVTGRAESPQLKRYLVVLGFLGAVSRAFLCSD